jgi:dihydroxyacetone kinase-like protein
MKKFMNTAESMLSESLAGFARCHADIVVLDPQHRFIRRTQPKSGRKVALVSGGGSGHEPLHTGFVGYGMLDAACPGHIFTSPIPDQMLAAAAAVDCGGGVLFIVKNYAGDVMNFSLAEEMYSGACCSVIAEDEVANEESTGSTGRRGVAGTLVIEKVLGAAAERGESLNGLKSLGARVNHATRSMGVALTSCTVPAVGKPTVELGETEMELGVGIHGEPGKSRVALKCADRIAEELVCAITKELHAAAGSEVLLLVNGLGGTPLMELYLMYEAADRELTRRGQKVARSLVGTYVTSLDMAGCSITVALLDQQLKELWDAPVHTSVLRW